MKNNIIVVNKNNLVAKHKCENESYEYFKYEVPKASENSKAMVAIYEIPPHKAGYPYHYHYLNEEVFYIISGNGLLKGNGLEKQVSKGDIMVCPPMENGAHMLLNTSDMELLTYIEFDISNYPEIIVYPNSNKIGIIKNKDDKLFFDKSATVDYYNKE